MNHGLIPNADFVKLTQLFCLNHGMLLEFSLPLISVRNTVQPLRLKILDTRSIDASYSIGSTYCPLCVYIKLKSLHAYPKWTCRNFGCNRMPDGSIRSGPKKTYVTLSPVLKLAFQVLQVQSRKALRHRSWTCCIHSPFGHILLALSR